MFVLQNVEDNSTVGKYRKVVFVEDFYSKLKDVHEMELLHAGYHKTYEKVLSLKYNKVCMLLIDLTLTAQVMNTYYGIPQSVVSKFTSMCPTCQL